MSGSWSLRLLRRLPLVMKAETLKRHHFAQQDTLLARAAALELAARSSLETEACLLQACHHMIEALGDVHRNAGQLIQRMEQLEALVHRNAGQLIQRMEQLAGELGEVRQASGRRLVQAWDYGLANPEIGLMQHLYASLPTRVAVDVGAHVGEMAGRLLEAGYEVYAFEPFPPVFRKLCERLGTAAGFRAASIAIGGEDGERELHLVTDTTVNKVYGDATQFSSLVRHAMPEGLVFAGEVPIRMRSLDSLWRDGELPEEVGLVKIDTEGYDLEVIHGMGEHRPPVVVAEFWDREASMGRSPTSNRLHDLVEEMRRRGYHWHVVMYRVDGSTEVSYFANRPRSVPQSWGNVLFFLDHRVFAEAIRWCAAVLPATYFTA